MQNEAIKPREVHPAYSEQHTAYEFHRSPLSYRYASKEMSKTWSEHTKYSTWRRVWIALAQAQQELDLPISQDQIDQMKAHWNNINFEVAAEYEKRMRHDVMAHIHAFGDQCPKARPIIHLGATSCLITDNADLIIIRNSLKLIKQRLLVVIDQLAELCLEYKDVPCIGYTHFQPAQPTTVGKRFCTWLQDLVLDVHELEHRLETLTFLGIKGATGTQASFLSLFEGDHEKVNLLEKKVAQKLGFDRIFTITGQTYTRKQDVHILNVLSSIATSAHKMATDLRLLAHLKELDEPIKRGQVGSSAMPYKQNPMQCERICSLSRYIMSLAQNPTYTAATQWFERTLDDSANRRLCIPDAFLATDAVLNLLINVTKHLTVHPRIIAKHLEEELPFIAMESILMACVKKGADRQSIHECLRRHSTKATHDLKENGTCPSTINDIAEDPDIPLSEVELKDLLKAEHFIGRAQAQVETFIFTEVHPLLELHEKTKYVSPEIQV